jgi:hypothetical protein
MKRVKQLQEAFEHITLPHIGQAKVSHAACVCVCVFVLVTLAPGLPVVGG